MLIIGYPLFQAGKILALRANNWLSSVSGREDLALRAKNRLSSVSGREVKCEVLVIWKVFFYKCTLC